MDTEDMSKEKEKLQNINSGESDSGSSKAKAKCDEDFMDDLEPDLKEMRLRKSFFFYYLAYFNDAFF